MARQKHLDLIERCRIETMLTDRHSFKSIARALNRDPTTIAKEVKAHMFTRKTGSLGKTFNNCANRSTCDYYNICSKTECQYHSYIPEDNAICFKYPYNSEIVIKLKIIFDNEKCFRKIKNELYKNPNKIVYIFANFKDDYSNSAVINSEKQILRIDLKK